MVGEDQLDRSTDDRVDDRGVHPDDAIDGQAPVEDVTENRRRTPGPFDQLGAVAGAVDLFEHPEPGRRRRQHEVTCPEHTAQLAGSIDDRQVLGSGIEQRDQRLDRRAGELDRRGRVHHHLTRGGVRGDSVADNPAAQHRIGDDPVGAITRIDDRAVHVTIRQLPCDDGDGRFRADDQRGARDEVLDRAEHRGRGGPTSGSGDVIGQEPGAAAGVERRLDQVARQDRNAGRRGGDHPGADRAFGEHRGESEHFAGNEPVVTGLRHLILVVPEIDFAGEHHVDLRGRCRERVDHQVACGELADGRCCRDRRQL